MSKLIIFDTIISRAFYVVIKFKFRQAKKHQIGAFFAFFMIFLLFLHTHIILHKKVVSIFGANASGKSSFIDAYTTFQKIARKSFQENNKDKKEIRSICEFGANFDERIADGYYFAKSVQLLQYIFDNPELLDDKASEIVNEK